MLKVLGMFRGFVAIVLCNVASPTAVAQMAYFGGGIDYWREAEHRPPQDSSAEKTDVASPAFDWQPYLDPSHDEFFREGDYLPPRPFMEVARNPTDDNLRQWFTYMEAKNAVQARLQSRMQEFLGGRSGPESQRPTRPIHEETSASAQALDRSRYVLRFYFDSTCPHCRRMAPEVEKIRALGFQVEAHQVDGGAVSGFGALKARVTPATSEELQRYGIGGVPVLLIADLQSKAVYRLNGFQTAESIVELLRTKS